MILRIAFNLEYRVVLTRGWGALTFDAILEYRSLVADDPRFRSDFAQISDFSNVTEMRLSEDEKRRLAKPHLFEASARRAFITTSTVQFGVARMFQAHGEVSGAVENILICRTLTEASAWVKVPEDVAKASFAELQLDPDRI